MIIFVVISFFVMYNLSLIYSGTYILNRKQTVLSRQKVKRVKVRLSVSVYFQKNTSNYYSYLCKSMRRSLKGCSVSVMNREHLMNKRWGFLINIFMTKNRQGIMSWVLLMKRVMTKKRYEMNMKLLCVWGQLIITLWESCRAKKMARVRHPTIQSYKKCYYL